MQRNPWITDVSDEDLVAQYEFGMRIGDQVDPASSAVIAIFGVKSRLDERLEEADDDETLIAAAERLRTAASAVERKDWAETLTLRQGRGDGVGSGLPERGKCRADSQLE